jgi:hypothetical protein
MTEKTVTMTDLMNRVASMNIAESDRRRALIALRQAEVLLTLATIASSGFRSVVGRLGRLSRRASRARRWTFQSRLSWKRSCRNQTIIPKLNKQSCT